MVAFPSAVTPIPQTLTHYEPIFTDLLALLGEDADAEGSDDFLGPDSDLRAFFSLDELDCPQFGKTPSNSFEAHARLPGTLIGKTSDSQAAREQPLQASSNQLRIHNPAGNGTSAESPSCSDSLDNAERCRATYRQVKHKVNELISGSTVTREELTDALVLALDALRNWCPGTPRARAAEEASKILRNIRPVVSVLQYRLNWIEQVVPFSAGLSKDVDSNRLLCNPSHPILQSSSMLENLVKAGNTIIKGLDTVILAYAENYQGEPERLQYELQRITTQGFKVVKTEKVVNMVSGWMEKFEFEWLDKLSDFLKIVGGFEHLFDLSLSKGR